MKVKMNGHKRIVTIVTCRTPREHLMVMAHNLGLKLRRPPGRLSRLGATIKGMVTGRPVVRRVITQSELESHGIFRWCFDKIRAAFPSKKAPA